MPPITGASDLSSERLEISRQLGPEERVLWSGQPRQGIRLHGYDALALPFSLVWLATVGFMFLMLIWDGFQNGVSAALLPPFLMLLLFLGIGLYLCAGRFWVDARMRAHVFYAVTTERVLIVSGFRSQRVKSLDIRSLSDLGLTERLDGSGTIHFGPPSPFAAWMPVPGWPVSMAKFITEFDRIPGARQVYELIRAAQRRAI